MPVWHSVMPQGDQMFPDDGRGVNLDGLHQDIIMSKLFFQSPAKELKELEPNHRREVGWFGKLMGSSPYWNHMGVSVRRVGSEITPQMVFTDKDDDRYYVDSWDLCNCPNPQKKPVGEICQDQEGKNKCQPGKALHDKGRKCVLKVHPDVQIIYGASIHDGKLDKKSKTINYNDPNYCMPEGKFKELQRNVAYDYDRSLAL